MPSQREPRYCHLITVVRQCGFKIAKELFLKKVKDETPKDFDPSLWTVDHFLDGKREDILGRRRGQDLKSKLYPGFSTPANLSQWDVSTFCFLLIDFCDLDDAIKEELEELRTVRNYLVHFGEGDIEIEDYQKHLKTIERIVKRCSDVLGDSKLKAELEAIIKEIKVVAMFDVEEELEKLKDWFFEELMEIHIIKQGFDELRTFLQDHLSRCEKNERSKTITLPFVINICFPGMNTESKEAQQGTPAINRCIELIKGDIRQMGAEVESDSQGSIIFKLTCFSITSLLCLLDYFSGPLLQRRLQEMRAEVEKINGDMMALQIYIPQDIIQEIKNKLGEEYSSEDAGLPSKRRKLDTKVFNDPIYGQIDFHPLCVKIIDTPQFQRLRHIKQLETVYLVYPGASHNRFEHSIGVCHLAGKLLRALKERQPELDITTKDILCVEIAALCHDLGQGPFSHVFENKFIPAVCPDIEWKHEKASVKMFEYMLRDNDGELLEYFRKMIPGFEERDIEFIKELIDVPVDTNAEVWSYKGRNKNKSFLYEVVANHVNGIDADRWDYIARDSYMLGMKTVFDHNRCIHHARVILAEGRKQICYRDKAAQDLYDMFYARMTLYRRAYQHKTHNIIGMMVHNALRDANDHVFFAGENGERLKISDTINDMKAFTHLTDDVLQKIQRSSKDSLKKSRSIINRIVQREFYKCICQTQVNVKQKGWVEKTAVQENLFNKIKQKRSDLTDLSEIIEIDVVNLDYGSKDKDPVTKVWFFKKGQENTAIRINKDQVSFVLPDTFAEQYVRVYSSVTDSQLLDVVEKSFFEWCTENDIPQPKGPFEASSSSL